MKPEAIEIQIYENRIYALEKIQHKALRYISKRDGNVMDITNHDYSEVTKQISYTYHLSRDLSSLPLRELTLTLHKIYSGKLNCESLSENLPSDNSEDNRDLNLRYVVPFYLEFDRTSNYLRNEPIYRMCDINNKFVENNNYFNFLESSEYFIAKKIEDHIHKFE